MLSSSGVLLIDYKLIVLRFIDTSTLVGHFVSSSKERVQGRKTKRYESEETEEIKTHSPFTITCYKDSRPCPTVSQYQLDVPAT